MRVLQAVSFDIFTVVVEFKRVLVRIQKMSLILRLPYLGPSNRLWIFLSFNNLLKPVLGNPDLPDVLHLK